MQDHYTTQRLLLDKLTINDDDFIFELVNTPEWIKFIGDRKVKNLSDANAYIRKIMESPAINYWVVRNRDTKIPMGIITLIKREYLGHPDIGFAFLKRYAGQGYAFEAAKEVLLDISKDGHEKILATTVRTNTNSISLLEKLGLRFDREMQWENEKLLVYSIKMV